MDALSIPRFDCTIDIPCGLAPDPMDWLEAVRLVREAVERMPGAAWISVDYSGLSPERVWITLYEPFCCYPMEGGAWDALAERVEAAVREALSRAN